MATVSGAVEIEVDIHVVSADEQGSDEESGGVVSAAGGGADVGSADRDAQDEPSIQIEVAPEEDSSPDPQTISYEPVKISVTSVNGYKAGDVAQIYLPGVPIIGQVSSNLTGHHRGRGPQFAVSLEHGPFKWSVYKYYTDFVSLRRALTPLHIRRFVTRVRQRRRKRGLPHLLSVQDVQPLQVARRTQHQLPKVRRFVNAVLNDREFRSNEHTLKFLEIGRLSFIEDLGSKRKEGLVSKRSGGHSGMTNCLGCHACCVCKFSVWRIRWFILKDSYLVYVRSDKNTIAGVLLFDVGTTVIIGPSHTGLVNGLLIGTLTRNLLVKCTSRISMKEWRDAIQNVLETTGKQWVSQKRFLSFAPPRTDCPVHWIVDAKDYFEQVAHAMLAAKEEIYITDWILSPQVYLKRSKDSIHNLSYRLDKLIYKKAQEGVKVYIQIYKDLTVALDLGSEYVKGEFKHRNIVVFRHPEHIASGIYKWAHHEKIIVIDQTLAFVGGIDLSFGRYDDHCHRTSDCGCTVTLQGGMEREQQQSVEKVYQWPGKDYYNPYIKDFVDLSQPHEDMYDREDVPRMPWHDIASCMFGAPARDVARHFIQRYNFTRHEQSLLEETPLLPRAEFTWSEKELLDYKYLNDVIQQQQNEQVDIQILRSASEWSAGTPTEHSILNAYVETIAKAEHFIYIENQFFISSLKDEVQNGIAESLRKRIARAHQEKKTFRVIIVMPLLPSFSGDFEDAESATLKIVLSWTYKSFSRGEDSLFSKLTQIDGVPEDELSNYISVYGLRNYSEISGNLVSEIVYVHSKCMVVDDRITIIGSANINDRSMLGERDSEVAIYVEDREMIPGKMNGEDYAVGKFSHSIRCHLFKEFLGLLHLQSEHSHASTSTINVEDPLAEEFCSSWSKIAQRNMEIFEKVFGGKIIPTDAVRNYSDLKAYKEYQGLKATDVEGAKKLLEEVQGFLVLMPLNFLDQEDLQNQLGNLVIPEIFV